MMNRLSLFALGLTFSCLQGLAAPLKIDLKVEKFVLPNGLTVLLHEDHTVPLISYHTWYRVGSRDESEGVTGAAHMLEHMMFKGAKKYSGKDFDRILHENGITNNAFTTADFTGFYENLPSNKLELMMDVEVDRMRNLALNPEDLKSELQVVAEERRWRVDNNPAGILREAFMSSIYSVHPYHWPVIGYMKDIQAYTVEKLRKFYDQFYVPNNAVLVLAGDFSSGDAKKMVEKYYGKLESHPIPQRSYPLEPEIKKKKFSEIEGEVQSETFLIGYPGVEAGHPDSYALDLLAAIAGHGNSSRLHKRLVYEKQTATSASVFNATNQNPGNLATVVSMKPGQSWKAAYQLAKVELEKFRTNAVSSRELQKVKNEVMKDFVDGLETMDEKAQALAINEIYFGDYKKMYSDLEKYDQVKVEDVQRVAKTYLQQQREVTLVLKPKKGKLK